MNATIKDVAKRADVSTATVSHVIHKTRFVSDELTQRVNDAIKELKFYPNLLVGSLRKNKTYSIGLVIPTITNESFSVLVEEIQQTLFANNYHIIICITLFDEEIENAVFNTLLTKKVDAICVIPTTTKSDKIQEIQERGVPVILIDRVLKELDIDSIIVDNFKGMYDATTHLIGLGHKHIGYIDRNQDHSHNVDQRNGYKKALEDHGLKYIDRLVVRSKRSDYASGVNAVKKLFAINNQLTAVMAFYDIIALGAMRGLKDMGLRVPEDVSLTGYDGMPLTEHTIPRLTTVLFPVEKIAKVICRTTLDRINNPNKTKKKKRVRLNPKLLIRETTSSPKC